MKLNGFLLSSIYLPTLFIFIFFAKLSRANSFLNADSLDWSSSYILDQHYLVIGKAKAEHLTIGSALLEGVLKTSESEFKFSILGSHGGHSPTHDLGDIQIVSNIDTEGVEALRIYEFYYGREIEGLEFSVGWRDLSLSINVTQPALMFVHSSFGTTAEWGATGFRGPSIYPIPAFGFYFASREKFDPFYIRASATDPLSADHFYPKQLQTHIRLNLQNHMAVVEGGFEPDPFSQMAIGVWNMEIEPGVVQSQFSQAGLYLQAHTQWGGHLSPFLRYGRAGRVQGYMFENRVIGINYSELFPNLDGGVGYSLAYVAGVRTPEEVYELIFQYSLKPWWQVQLSQQQIINPALGKTDGQLSTLRMIFSI